MVEHHRCRHALAWGESRWLRGSSVSIVISSRSTDGRGCLTAPKRNGGDIGWKKHNYEDLFVPITPGYSPREERRDSMNSYPLPCHQKSKNSNDSRDLSAKMSTPQMAVCVALQSSKGPGGCENVSSYRTRKGLE